MSNQPLFTGLVTDEDGNAVESGFIGNEPCYVINDAGFRRHVPAEQIDRAVLAQMAEMMKGSEDILSEQTAKMLGQDDPFSKAMIEQQIKNIDQQFDALMKTGMPDEMRAYLGMMGFKVIVNYHGELIRVEQPAAASNEDDDDDK
jgi:cell fate (sporulation/competence/biofilm development) regulator YlbF (YheA/YmcA/DUF963 family)